MLTGLASNRDNIRENTRFSMANNAEQSVLISKWLLFRDVIPDELNDYKTVCYVKSTNRKTQKASLL